MWRLYHTYPKTVPLNFEGEPADFLWHFVNYYKTACRPLKISSKNFIEKNKCESKKEIRGR